MFSFVGLGQEEDALIHFDASKNNVSIGVDLVALRRSANARGFTPMFLKYEKSLSKHIGLGGVFYYRSDATTTNRENIVLPNGEMLGYDTERKAFAIMPKINWHFTLERSKNKKLHSLDLYGGIGLGYGYAINKTDYLMNYQPPEGKPNSYIDQTETYHYLATEFNLGARFYILENIGLYLEAGYGLTYVQFGLIYQW